MRNNIHRDCQNITSNLKKNFISRRIHPPSIQNIKVWEQYFCFEIINHCIPVLKLNFKKIELQVELDINNIKFYTYFTT